jgi:hypothetical protein
MTTITQVCMGIHLDDPSYSSSGDDWALIINVDGQDVLHRIGTLADLPIDTIGFVVVENGYSVPLPRDLPPQSFARVYSFGNYNRNNRAIYDPLDVEFSFDSALLNPSSIRLSIHGSDIIRPKHIVLWGTDSAMAIVPLALNTNLDMNDTKLSEDRTEGRGSIPLTLVDSGTGSTQLNEVLLYVSLANDRNAGTRQPATFRIDNADGNILFQSALEDFQLLETNSSNANAKNAKLWLLSSTTPPFSRMDAQGRPVVPKLSVTGPDNAMIQEVVAFGLNRGGPRAVVVPLVHHVPGRAGSNPWVGTHQSPEGRDMVLPLCPMAPRQ